MKDWEMCYQQGDTSWDRGDVSPALEQWLSGGVLKPCRILIPGCGRGHEVVQLARCGFSVTAVDIAPSATGHLERELIATGLSADVICGDLFEFEAESAFDAVYEQTCLCAIEPEQRAAYEHQLHVWLKPGGMLFALLMQTGQTGGPPFHCDLLAMRQLFADARWTWPENEPLLVARKNGRFELGYRLIRQ